MIPVRVAQEKNTRNAADSTKRHHCGAHRMVTLKPDEPNLGSTSANMNKGGSGAGDGGNLEQGTTPAVVIGRRAPRRDNR